LLKKGFIFKLTHFFSNVCGKCRTEVNKNSLALATRLSRCFKTRHPHYSWNWWWSKDGST